jgi:hypothetical protein
MAGCFAQVHPQVEAKAVDVVCVLVGVLCLLYQSSILAPADAF